MELDIKTLGQLHDLIKDRDPGTPVHVRIEHRIDALLFAQIGEDGVLHINIEEQDD